MLEGAGALAVIAAGIPLDRSWRRDRALPFYGLGFVWLIATVLTYASQGLPVTLFEPSEEFDSSGCSILLHGLGMVAAKPLESARQHFPQAFKTRETP